MKQISYKPYVATFGLLIFIVLNFACHKDNIIVNTLKTNSSALLNPNGTNLASSALVLSQTKTATRLNYNFEGNLVGNYVGSAEDVAYNDNLYAHTIKLAPRRGYALLVLEGFGFEIS